MTEVVLLLIGALSFLCGFLMGAEKGFKRKLEEKEINRIKAVSFTKEYENFLNYDGSEQN